MLDPALRNGLHGERGDEISRFYGLFLGLGSGNGRTGGVVPLTVAESDLMQDSSGSTTKARVSQLVEVDRAKCCRVCRKEDVVKG